MGVKGLWELLSAFSTPTVPDTTWRGKRIAIDASVWVEQLRRVSSAAAAHDEHQAVLEGFLRRLLRLLALGIVPVVVFDGPAPALKRSEQQRRIAATEAMHERGRRRLLQRLLVSQLAHGRLHNAGQAPMSVEQATAIVAKAIDARTLLESTHRHEMSSSSAAQHPHASTSDTAHRGKRRRTTTPNAEVVDRAGRGDGAAVLARWAARRRQTLLGRFERLKAADDAVDAINKHNMLRGSASSFLGPSAVLAPDFTSAAAAVSESRHREGHTEACATEARPVFDAQWHSELREAELAQRLLDELRPPPTTVTVVSSSCSSSGGNDSVVTITSSASASSSVDGSSVVVDGTSSDADSASSSEASSSVSVVILDTDCTAIDPAASNRADPRPVQCAVRVVAPLNNLPRAVPAHLVEIVDLLGAMGVSYVFAPAEADATCGYLSATDQVDAVITEDSDVFLFGAKVVLRGFYGKSKTYGSRSRSISMHRAEELAAIGLDRAALVTFALLAGSDYTAGVRGISMRHVVSVMYSFVSPPCCSTAQPFPMRIAQVVEALANRLVRAVGETCSEALASTLGPRDDDENFLWVRLRLEGVSSIVHGTLRRRPALALIEEPGVRAAALRREAFSLGSSGEEYPSVRVIEAYCAPLVADLPTMSNAQADWRRVRDIAAVRCGWGPQELARIDTVAERFERRDASTELITRYFPSEPGTRPWPRAESRAECVLARADHHPLPAGVQCAVTIIRHFLRSKNPPIQ